MSNPCPKCDVVNKGCQFMTDCPLKDEHFYKALDDVAKMDLKAIPTYSFEAGVAAMRAIGMGGNVKIILERLKNGSFDDVTLNEALGRDV